MKNAVTIEFDEVIQRLKEELGEESDAALSRALGMSNSGIAVARKSKSLPIIPIVNTCCELGISLDEIFLGKTKSKSSAQAANTFTLDDIIRASKLVVRTLERVSTNNSLPTERQLDAYKKLHTVFIKAVIENDFDESIVTAIAEASIELV
ncbi:helix-turn-helix domain-containing protein [Aliikangiella maris]|uniref:Helix-turn-helix domain-containing protein n=2 Tax=Aliikangiella maris TaxID=3162458 RepID=A0ABV3MJL6_9GAMM